MEGASSSVEDLSLEFRKKWFLYNMFFTCDEGEISMRDVAIDGGARFYERRPFFIDSNWPLRAAFERSGLRVNCDSGYDFPLDTEQGIQLDMLLVFEDGTAWQVRMIAIDGFETLEQEVENFQYWILERSDLHFSSLSIPFPEQESEEGIVGLSDDIGEIKMSSGLVVGAVNKLLGWAGKLKK